MKKIPVIFSCIILISVIVLEYLFLLWELFNNFPHNRYIFHLLGGASTGVSMYYLFYKHLIKLLWLLQMVYIIGEVSLAAVGWECYEWLHSYAMEDLLSRLLGGTIACIYILLLEKRNRIKT